MINKYTNNLEINQIYLLKDFIMNHISLWKDSL